MNIKDVQAAKEFLLKEREQNIDFNLFYFNSDDGDFWIWIGGDEKMMVTSAEDAKCPEELSKCNSVEI